MHGVDLSQVTSQCSPGPHLDPADRLHAGRGLRDGRIAGRFASILPGVQKLR